MADRPTLADVARAAGVSPAAASYALNDRPGVSPATRDRVKEAARRLGWHPDARGRALALKRAAAVGLVVARAPHILATDPFFAIFLAGVEATLAARDCNLVLRLVHEGPEEHAAYERLMRSRTVDGFLLTDLRHQDERPRQLSRLGAPAVALGRPRSDGTCSWVWFDDRRGVCDGVEHLLELGHRRIAHVSGPLTYVHARARAAAWQMALRRQDVADHLLHEADLTPESGAAATKRLLDVDDPPTAIVYANDLMALSGMGVLADLDIDVPGDVSILGFDDIPLAAYSWPPLSTIHTDVEAWGAAAAAELLDAIELGTTRRRRLPPATLILRGSTGPAKSPVPGNRRDAS